MKTSKPQPVQALIDANDVIDSETLKLAIDGVRTKGTETPMDWTCDDMGYTPCGQYRVGKVVVTNASKILGLVLIPRLVNDLALGNKTMVLVNVPMFIAPFNADNKQGMKHDVLTAAIVARGMPDWFASGTPPRKSAPQRQKEEEGNWIL